jgi:hypothetical protein
LFIDLEKRLGERVRIDVAKAYGRYIRGISGTVARKSKNAERENPNV